MHPAHSLQEILQDNEAEELKESRLRVNGWRGQAWRWRAWLVGGWWTPFGRPKTASALSFFALKIGDLNITHRER